MRHAQSFAAILLLAAALSAGCAGCETENGEPDANGQNGGDGGETDGDVQFPGDPTKMCAPLGGDCSSQPCCVGACNADNVCEQGQVGCAGAGEGCTDNLDCCTNRCGANGTCSAQQCVDNGAACTGNNDCCTGNCSGGTCAPIPGGGSCKVQGQSCGSGGECCSTNCQGGTCAPAYTCRAGGDLCYGDGDCCSNLCSKNDGSAGFCRTPSGGCIQDGLPCSSGTNCCTRVCSDPGTGVKVCLPASGCRMTGNSCTDAQACCGGGSNPNGSVQCDKEVATDDYGRCDNGQACNPVGNICGAVFNLPDGGTFTVNASQNCCNGKKESCKLDSSGIPRCFGGGSTECPQGYTGEAPCCIEEGQVCQFKDQCCDGNPCVPDNGGVLRCTKSTCIPLGNACTPGTGTCCSGDCLPAGEFGHACQLPGTGGGTDGGTAGDGGMTSDAGTTDGGGCKPNGQMCSQSAECCSGTCENGTCQTPSACQGTGDVCTSTADCCTGNSCVVPAGSSSGTCQPSTCAGPGQGCTGAGSCCAGLSCLKAGQNAACDGTTACICSAILG